MTLEEGGLDGVGQSAQFIALVGHGQTVDHQAEILRGVRVGVVAYRRDEVLEELELTVLVDHSGIAGLEVYVELRG